MKYINYLLSFFDVQLTKAPTNVEKACRELNIPYYKDMVKCPKCDHNFDGSKNKVY